MASVDYLPKASSLRGFFSFSSCNKNVSPNTPPKSGRSNQQPNETHISNAVYDTFIWGLPRLPMTLALKYDRVDRAIISIPHRRSLIRFTLARHQPIVLPHKRPQWQLASTLSMLPYPLRWQRRAAASIWNPPPGPHPMRWKFAELLSRKKFDKLQTSRPRNSTRS